MVVKILIGIAVVIGGLFGYASLQPSEYKIFREVVVSASPEAIFPFINNNEKANSWMPWKESDPNVQMTYSGPPEGVDSKASWTSTGSMGVGEALVIESVPNKSVKTQLTYTKPMAMSQVAEVTLTPEANGTVVRWSVVGHNNIIARVFCIFMNMDKMVGTEFEKGLNNLKALVEKK